MDGGTALGIPVVIFWFFLDDRFIQALLVYTLFMGAFVSVSADMQCKRLRSIIPEP
jgi:hypothetical protein